MKIVHFFAIILSMVNIQQLERGLKPFKPGDAQEVREGKEISDQLRVRVDSLEPEQQRQLEQRVRASSEVYFKMVQQHVEAAQDDIAAAFSEHGAQLAPDMIEPMLVAGGLDTASATEVANQIAELAKRANSPDDFRSAIKASFDPEQRLSLTVAHWRARSEHSWYFGTPEGQTQLSGLIDEVAATENN
ncbi:MAG: hypothetical protein HY565_05960 [Candidatus Kerfeldbacteria bacterium]|nr:hypothetical protein [Candidatus Kerfeldbacteria bacterium]